MKKTILLFSCVVALAAVSCKKETKDSNGTPPVGTAYDNFSLTIDGTDFDPAAVIVQHNGGFIQAQAGTASEMYFALSIDDTLEPGTYQILPGQLFRLSHTDDNFMTSYLSTSGSVTIVTHDMAADKISGFYNCTLTRANPAATKTVTNGEFNIDY